MACNVGVANFVRIGVQLDNGVTSPWYTYAAMHNFLLCVYVAMFWQREASMCPPTS